MLPILALCILGPIATLNLDGLQALDGGPDVSLLVTAEPVIGLISGLAILAGAAIYGILAGKLVDARTGTLSAGFLVAWAAWRTGNLGHIFRIDPSSGVLVRLAIEAAIVGVGAALVALLVAGTRPADQPVPHTDLPGPHLGSLTQLAKPPVLGGIVAGAAAALVVAYVVAFNPLRGQALMAGVLGAIAAGAIARLVVHAASGHEAPSAAPYAAVVLAAVVAPLIGFIIPGATHLESASLSQSLPGFLLVQPLDWAAGMLIGTPIGLAWAGAAVHKARDVESAPAR